MRVDTATDELVLLSEHNFNPPGSRWALDDFPATRWVLEHRVPGQVVAGDEAGDPAELAELAAIGMASLLIIPVVFGGRAIAVLEVYRVLPQAFTAREVDRARVLAQQFGAALDRLTTLKGQPLYVSTKPGATEGRPLHLRDRPLGVSLATR